MKFFLIIAILLIIPFFAIDVFGHSPGLDRALAIKFDDRDVTIIAKMNPSDMTVGDFSNAFMQIQFVEEIQERLYEKIEGKNCIDRYLNGTYYCTYDVPIKQTTFRVEVERHGKLLAREMFYTDDEVLTVDIRPNDSCSVDQVQPWKCTNYYGTRHSIAGALYTFGQNNPVIDGPIFTKGGMYNIKVEVLGAESPRSNLLKPLEFELFVSIAQEQTFYINPETGEVRPA